MPNLRDHEAQDRVSAAWSTSARPRLAGLVTTFNSEARLRACLESIAWCDEILVVDSYSTDATLAIAQSFPNVRVIQRPYFGAASQKNWGVLQLTADWVFILDSDEVCRPDLRDEIQSLLVAGAPAHAFFIHRRVYFLNRRIRFSGWRHDRVGRLFKIGAARFERRRVHPVLVADGPAPMLRHSLDHYMVDSFDEYAQRLVTYSVWGAAQAYREGRRAGLREVAGRSTYRFFRTYVLQLGILDGRLGFVACSLQAMATFLKWSRLWAWRLNEARGVPPELPAFDDDSSVWDGLPR